MALKSIDIRIRVDAVKFAKLLDLIPDHEKGGGEKSTVIYWAIDSAIDSAIAAKLKELNTANRNISNREYLRRS